MQRRDEEVACDLPRVNLRCPYLRQGDRTTMAATRFKQARSVGTIQSECVGETYLLSVCRQEIEMQPAQEKPLAKAALVRRSGSYKGNQPFLRPNNSRLPRPRMPKAIVDGSGTTWMLKLVQPVRFDGNTGLPAISIPPRAI